MYKTHANAKYCPRIGAKPAFMFLLLLLTGSPAFALMPCEQECDLSSDCSTACLIDFQIVVTCGEYGVCDDEPRDMVEWMKQTYTGATSTHLEQLSGGVISEFSACGFSNGFYRTNSGTGEYHELFTYDDTWINIWREVFDASAAHFKTHDNFHWLQRYMAPGDCFTADCTWREYNGSCTSPPETSCSTTVCLEGPVTLSLGGDIGTVEALVRTQLRGDGDKEHYFYAKPYGMVQFELRQSDGTLVYREIFNQIVSGEITPNSTPCFSVC